MDSRGIGKKKKIQVLRSGIGIEDSLVYIKDYTNVGYIIEFNVRSLYAAFEQEDCVILECSKGIRKKVLILSKISEGEFLHVRGLALMEGKV